MTKKKGKKKRSASNSNSNDDAEKTTCACVWAGHRSTGAQDENEDEKNERIFTFISQNSRFIMPKDILTIFYIYMKTELVLWKMTDIKRERI